jgi:hypothetical protein
MAVKLLAAIGLCCGLQQVLRSSSDELRSSCRLTCDMLGPGGTAQGQAAAALEAGCPVDAVLGAHAPLRAVLEWG